MNEATVLSNTLPGIGFPVLHCSEAKKLKTRNLKLVT